MSTVVVLHMSLTKMTRHTQLKMDQGFATLLAEL